MTRREAFAEYQEMERRINSWSDTDRRPPLTPYQQAVRKRASDLRAFVYAYSYYEVPCEASEWVCPPKDVEETVENFYRHQFCMEPDPDARLRELRERFQGGYPPPMEWTADHVARYGE